MTETPFDPAVMLATLRCQDLKRDAVAMDPAEGFSILVASLPDVIRSKSTAGREKDQALPRLQALLERISGPRGD